MASWKKGLDFFGLTVVIFPHQKKAMLPASRKIPFLIALIFFVGCAPYKKMMKEAKILEDGGLRQEAFIKYQEVFSGWDKAEARVGMKRMAQGIANDKIANARMSCLAGNYEAALNQYEDAINYVNNLSELGINQGLNLETSYQQCRELYIDALYTTAEDQVYKEEYESAKKNINRILSIDRNNQKAEYLLMMCEIVPNYRSAMKAMELKEWRTAYDYFSEVIGFDPGYKDVLELREQCRQNGMYSIAYISIDNKRIDNAVEGSLSSAIQNCILDLKDPFIQLIDRDNMEQILNEQQQSMSAAFDESTALKAGQLLGARYIITGELLNYSNEISGLRSVEMKGFLGPALKDKKIKYIQMEQERQLSVAYRYRLLDAVTGQVFASGVLPFTDRDLVQFADFEGDHTMIYPGEWKWQLISNKEDIIRPEERERVQKLFNSRRKPISELEMNLLMIDALAGQVGQEVSDFRPPGNGGLLED